MRITDATLYMHKRIVYILPAILALTLVFHSCSKQTETIQTDPIADYLPMEIGKTITYKMDSTVYVSLNTVKEVHSYVVKDIVEAEVTDNIGNPSYRIRRMIRSNDDTLVWGDNATFIVTPLGKSMEYIDNNQRFIKLQEPIREDFVWKGNSYINTYSNPDLQYLDNWEYYYFNVGMPFTLPSMTVDSSFTVVQRDEVLGDPNNKSFYYEINQASEVYGKGIGLIYRNFLHEAWQPPNITSVAGYYEPNSYGITLTMLSHD